MRTIYIDSDFKCHATNDGTLKKVLTDDVLAVLKKYGYTEG